VVWRLSGVDARRWLNNRTGSTLILARAGGLTALLERYEEIPQWCDLFRSLVDIATVCSAFIESQNNHWLVWAGGGDNGTARSTEVGDARTATIFAIAASFLY
jgi:hypothetical protein